MTTIAYKDGGTLWFVGADGGRIWRSIQARDEPNAIGSGSEHALTAMDMGCSAREAVKMAGERDIQPIPAGAGINRRHSPADGGGPSRGAEAIRAHTPTRCEAIRRTPCREARHCRPVVRRPAPLWRHPWPTSPATGRPTWLPWFGE